MMRLLSPGSTPWLLAHEMRLTLRGRGKVGKGRWTMAILFGVLVLFLMWPGWLLAPLLRHVPHLPPPEVSLILDIVLVGMFTLMTSATVAQTAQAFYERGDLDLLLSSPVSPRRVLTVRCVGIALAATMFWALILTPFVLPAIVLGDWRWLMAYPVLLGLGLLAAAVGLAIAMGLFRLIGPKRTRSAATIVSAIIGTSFGLLAQVRNFMGRDVSQVWWDKALAFADAGWFNADRPLAWPARALFGDPLAALAVSGAALAVFALVTQSVGGRFARDAAAAAGVSRRVRAARGQVKAFAGGLLGVTVAKELRLIRRDGTLLSQTLIQVLYIGILIGALLFKNSGGSNRWIIAGGASLMVFLAGNLASVFGWIVMSAEDSPELLAASPASSKVLRRGKLIAAMIPVAMIMAIPVGLMIWFNPLAGIAGLVCGAGLSWSAGLLSIWFEKPAKRSELRRRRNGSWINLMLMMFQTTCWSGAAYLIALGFPLALFAFLPLLVGLVVLGAVSKPDRAFADTLVNPT